MGPLFRYAYVPKAFDWLAGAGLIEHDKRSKGTRNRGRQSSAAPTEELREIVRTATDGARIVHPPIREPIILRDADKAMTGYTDNRHTTAMRKRVRLFNEGMTAAAITGAEVADMVRVFNGSSWHLGGRFYGPWQNLPEGERTDILIGGERTVELDFKTIHPAMLYAERGRSLPSDCYDIPGFDRGHVKLAVNVLINASTEASAVMAIAAGLENDERDQRGRKRLKVDEDIPGYRLNAARTLIAVVKKRHAPIADAFHTGAGLRLQGIDARIADAVCSFMYGRGIVVLPVHDSFIVQVRHADLLCEAMERCAREVGKVALQVVSKRSNPPVSDVQQKLF